MQVNVFLIVVALDMHIWPLMPALFEDMFRGFHYVRGALGI